MICAISLTVATDRPVWVNWQSFMQCVDRDDLECREVKNVEGFYLSDWFSDYQGTRGFIPPAIELRNGTAYFINGRHRAVMLSSRMEFVPMAITRMTGDSESALQSFAVREIHLDEMLTLPDLPIKSGPLL